MGLLTGILTLPLAPLRGVVWIGDVLVRAAEQELNDDSRIRSRMHELEQELAAGAISEADFDQEWDDLMQRLLMQAVEPGLEDM